MIRKRGTNKNSLSVQEDSFNLIRKLVGEASPEDLRYVDCFVSRNMSVFMPQGGACFYALSPEHSHPSYMFLLDFDGRTSMRLDGKSITSEAGKVFALPPGVKHQELPSDEPPRYIAIMIDKRFFVSQLSRYPDRSEPLAGGEFFDAPEALLPALRRFMIEADGNLSGADDMLGAIAVEVCHVIIRGLLGVRAGKESVSERIEVDRAVEYMNSSLGSKITVDDLARAAHMSGSHFSRIFRKETGQSPMEYLLGIRLKRVKKLLLAGDLTVTEIAHSCGFSSAAYLSDRFSRAFGKTPSGFRKSIISKE